MSEETWHGIPRKKIPWFPTIDYQKCIACGKCVDYCKLGTYELGEKDGEKRSVVKNPYNCVVLCRGCDDICPAGAISHPSKKEIGNIIRNLRKKNNVEKENRETIETLKKADDLHQQRKK